MPHRGRGYGNSFLGPQALGDLGERDVLLRFDEAEDEVGVCVQLGADRMALPAW